MLPVVPANPGVNAVVVYRLIYPNATEAEAVARVADLCKDRFVSRQGQFMLSDGGDVRRFASFLRPRGEHGIQLRDIITRSFDPVLTALRAAGAPGNNGYSKTQLL